MAGVLSEEELALWQQEADTARPLNARMRADRRIPKKMVLQPRSTPEIIIPIRGADVALALGNYAGIDKRTADKFRKGKYAIDAALDLHGMSREQAHMALFGFVHGNYALGNRCLLLISGKGAVLRELVPHWLDEPGLRPFVLALEQAKQQHGGSGAYYILLRRKR